MLVASWAAIVVANALLINEHVLEQSGTSLSVVAGLIAGPSAMAIWYGEAGSLHVIIQLS